MFYSIAYVKSSRQKSCNVYTFFFLPLLIVKGPFLARVEIETKKKSCKDFSSKWLNHLTFSLTSGNFPFFLQFPFWIFDKATFSHRFDHKVYKQNVESESCYGIRKERKREKNKWKSFSRWYQLIEGKIFSSHRGEEIWIHEKKFCGIETSNNKLNKILWVFEKKIFFF